MRIMNYLLTIALVLMVGSCSKERPAENDDLAAVDFKSRIDQEKEKTQEVFELDLHQYQVLGQLATLERQKRELEEQIEGGDEKQIPVLETVMVKININTDFLKAIHESSCDYLRTEQRRLDKLVREGKKEHKSELEEVNKKVKQCDEGYTQTPLYIYPPLPRVSGEGGGGGCFDTGPEMGGCKHILNEGKLLINTLDSQEEVRRVQLQTMQGEVISEGNPLGKHSTLEGVSQIGIEITALENGVLEIVKGNSKYRSEVEIR